ncbi:unnamed protein product [Amoebophrya sp. A120]|nr:unnamed protein product [Amoebophrya sp. A120]|eukprot:GSA120T00002452001.1
MPSASSSAKRPLDEIRNGGPKPPTKAAKVAEEPKKSTTAGGATSTKKEVQLPVIDRIMVVKKNHEAAFRELGEDGKTRIRVEDWKRGEIVKSAIGWTPCPIDAERDPGGASDYMLEKLYDGLTSTYGKGRTRLSSGNQMQHLVDYLRDSCEPPMHCDPSEANNQKGRAENFWNEYCLMDGDLVVVSGGSKKPGFEQDDGVALCEVLTIRNACYSGTARCGIGGSANSGEQAGKSTFSENKFYLRMKVLKVWEKGEGCPLQQPNKDGNYSAITVATNQKASVGGDFRKAVWKALTKEEQKLLVDKLLKREELIAKVGFEAIPKYRAQAERRAIPLYTAEAVKDKKEFPVPQKPTFETLRNHLQVRSLPKTTRTNVSVGSTDWKSFGWIKSHFVEVHTTKQSLSPAAYVESQFEIPWAREMLRQITMLAKEEAAKKNGLPVTFTAIGVGKNNLTGWHQDRGNKRGSSNYQFALGDFDCEMGYAAMEVNKGRVVLRGVKDKTAGDVVLGCRGPSIDDAPAKEEQCIFRDCKNKWIAFDPYRWHRTETHGNDRWVATCYTHEPPTSAKEKKDLVTALKKLGFPVPADW